MSRLQLTLLTLLLGLLTGGVVTFYLLQKSHPSPQNSSSHTLTIEKIHTLGRLELLHYVVRDVATYRWTYSVPFTESRLLLILHGEATICMDFSQIQIAQKDPQTHTLTLILPPPEVCHVKIDPQKSQVYDASFSIVEWWRDGEAHRVREALAQAQDSLRKSISATFPRDLAYAQAKALLTHLLQEAGWTQITFTTSENPTPNP